MHVRDFIYWQFILDGLISRHFCNENACISAWQHNSKEGVTEFIKTLSDRKFQIEITHDITETFFSDTTETRLSTMFVTLMYSKKGKVKHTFTTQHQTIPFSNIIHLDHLENISVCTCTQATFLGVTFWLWGPYLTYTHILLLENFLAAKLATFNVLTLVWLVINQQK